MHKNASCFPLADDYFQLNLPSSWRSSFVARQSRQRTVPWPDLMLRPLQEMRHHRRNEPVLYGILSALLLHLLCFSLLIAHEYYSVDKTDTTLTGGGSKRSSGMLIGQVVLSRVSTAVPGAPPASQEDVPKPLEASVPDTPREPPAEEKSAAPVEVAKSTRTVPLKAAKPAQKKTPEVRRRSTKATPPSGQATTAKSSVSGTTHNEKSGAQDAASTALSSKNSGLGTTGNETQSTGGMAAFGGSNGPSFKRFSKPEYPAQARRQNITGRVLLRIRISASGVVERVEVMESAHELLSKAAIKAVERSSFHPLQRNGKPVSCWTLLPISFALEHS